MLKVFMPFEYSFISPLCATCSCLSLHHVSVFSRWDPLSSEKAIGLFSTCLSGLLENVCPPAGYQFLLPHNGRLDWLVSNDLFKLTVVLYCWILLSITICALVVMNWCWRVWHLLVPGSYLMILSTLALSPQHWSQLIYGANILLLGLYSCRWEICWGFCALLGLGFINTIFE